MKIEIWSDVMCPFCYIGKRNLESALTQLPERNNIEIEWKSYQLDPTMPEDETDTYTGYLSKKRNVSEAQGNELLASVSASAKKIGLDYNFDKALMTNSFKAHVLIQFAKSKGKGNQMEERLFKAFFTDGKNISDSATLIQLGIEVGLNEAEIIAALTNEGFVNAVKKDINEAKEIGVTGVPFFVLDRKYAISGAQPPEVMLDNISKVFRAWKVIEKMDDVPTATRGSSCSANGGECD